MANGKGKVREVENEEGDWDKEPNSPASKRVFLSPA